MDIYIEVEKILIYYDIPQLFIGKDCVDTKYICLLTKNEELFDEYVAIKTSVKRIGELEAGKIDLRKFFTNPEILNDYYIIHSDGKNFIITSGLRNINEEQLPNEGILLNINHNNNEL